MSSARRAGRLRTAMARSKALRVAPVLAVAAVAGYLVGGCAGDGSSGLPGLSGVTELPSGSLPTLPIRTETEPETTEANPTTTEEAPTTLPEPTTSEEAPATTTTETETEPTTPTEPATGSTDTADTTTTEESDEGIWGWVALGVAVARGQTTDAKPAPTTTAATTTEETDTLPTETVTPEPASSESSAPWGWIALAVAAIAAGVVGFLVWRGRRIRGRDDAA